MDVMTAQLLDSIKKYLPALLADMMKQATSLARSKGMSLYIVGGSVRDAMLGRANFDLDLVVEGDAIALAMAMAQVSGARLTVHHRFNTAKLKSGSWAIDIAQARSETYARPGALPVVRQGTLQDDLFRRDFTINAMAVRLTPAPAGELIDPFGGCTDLKHKLIRVLHDKSFIDDATRIWRAIRYEQRLGFNLEAHTLELLKASIPNLDAISGDRLRHELEAVLKEKEPEEVLHRAWILKALARIYPSLRGDTWLARKFRQAREVVPVHQLVEIYPALLTYRLDNRELEEYIKCLRPTQKTTTVLRDTQRLKGILKSLEQKDTKNSKVYELLRNFNNTSALASVVATSSVTARDNLKLYLEKLRYVRPVLNGDDLLRLGVPPGPGMQELLTSLLYARLDEKLKTKADEEAVAKKWLHKRA
jgi:tRNA nucleotidyltransferase (CCA-adding enzyme)